MASIAVAPAPDAMPVRIVRVACRALAVSAVVSTAGIVFLVGMFGAFAVGASSIAMVLGTANDALVIAQYVLLLPAVIALHTVLRRGSPRARLAIAALGVVGIVGVAVLQGLLVAGALTFEEQIGRAAVAYIPLAAWFVASGWLATRSDLDPRGTAMGVIAATYVGFPIWAWRLAGRLRRLPIIEASPRAA